ncbi:MAG: hypothetical protein WCW40_08975, partial [Bacteroidota bacterium]
MMFRTLVLTVVLVVTAAAQSFLGNITSYTNDGNTVVVHADSSAVRLMLYADDIVRVDLLPSALSTLDSSFVVIQSPSKDVPYTVHETDSVVELITGKLLLRLQKYPLRISVFDAAGTSLLAEPQNGGYSFENDTRTLRFTLGSNDHFYGTGERGTAMDKRRQKFTNYNTQVGNYLVPLATMNLNVPVITTPNGYALYIDNTYRGEFDFGVTDSTQYSYTAEGGELSYYIIAAKTIAQQLEKYTWLTGRQPLPPRWAFGFIQSKNRYENEEVARSIVT